MSTTGAAPTTFGFARVLRAIVIAGAVAGPVDIGSASLINWAAPDRVARFIARGLIGDAAKTGGAGAAVSLGSEPLCLSVAASGAPLAVVTFSLSP